MSAHQLCRAVKRDGVRCSFQAKAGCHGFCGIHFPKPPAAAPVVAPGGAAGSPPLAAPIPATPPATPAAPPVVLEPDFDRGFHTSVLHLSEDGPSGAGCGSRR